MNRLKVKINTSFLLLSALLVIAAIISLIELRVLDKSFNRLVINNYKSVEGLSNMYDALELSNSGVLLLISGNWEEGRTTLKTSHNLFNTANLQAKQALTDSAEIIKLNQINLLYQNLWMQIEKPIENLDHAQELAWYQSDFHFAYRNIKVNINELIRLHQENLYTEASKVKDFSKRAIMPAIVSIIASLIFALLLNFYIVKYFVYPLNNLVKGLKELKPGQASLGKAIDTDKSIQELVHPINDLIRKNNQLNKDPR